MGKTQQFFFNISLGIFLAVLAVWAIYPLLTPYITKFVKSSSQGTNPEATQSAVQGVQINNVQEKLKEIDPESDANKCEYKGELYVEDTVMPNPDMKCTCHGVKHGELKPVWICPDLFK